MERSIWQITSRFSFEGSIIEPNATLEQVDEHYDYSKLLTLLGIRTNSKESRLSKLELEGLLKLNLQDRFDVKALMAIACATDLNVFPALRLKGMRLLVYAGTDKDVAVVDMEGKRGYAVVFETLLANIMKAISLGETFEGGVRTVRYAIPEEASGVDRAVKAIERLALPPPLIQAVEGSTIVTLFRERPFAKLTPEERVRACYQHACVSYEAGEAMSNASLRGRFGLSQKQYPQISNVIRDAVDADRREPEAHRA